MKLRLKARHLWGAVGNTNFHDDRTTLQWGAAGDSVCPGYEIVSQDTLRAIKMMRIDDEQL